MNAHRCWPLCMSLSLLLTACVATAEEQYKKRPALDVALIAQGDYDTAIRNAKEYLEEHPGDLEALYCLALAHAKKGEGLVAMGYMRQAVDGGLPFDRFLAGPRELVAVSTDSSHVTTGLIHGPTLGCVTDSSARFWVRLSDGCSAQVAVHAKGSGGETDLLSDICGPGEVDRTAVVEVQGLAPNTAYEYKLRVNGEELAGSWGFRTFPAAGQAAAFTIGFGGGAGYTPQYERMWHTLAARKLLAFLFLGDNVYIDHPEVPAVQRYCYYRRQSRPEFREFAASTALYAIYDDHDFTVNDGWGGPEIDEPAWKRPVWRLFRANWNNPAYGGGEANPGCWFSFSIADVDFILLDGRYYRSNPKRRRAGSMLGPVQKAWLFDTLRASKGAFKMLASPVPWDEGVKPGSRDTWDGYAEERESIYAFIESERIEGVVLLSADRHRSDLWKIERPGGYGFYEFESSRLSNIHTHKAIPGVIFSYNAKCSFGQLHFDTTKADPEVTYDIVTIDDETVHSFTLKRSPLAYK